MPAFLTFLNLPITSFAVEKLLRCVGCSLSFTAEFD